MGVWNPPIVVNDISLAGNTVGALANISSGTFFLAGGNNITLSQNGNSVTISGPNAGGAQTGISGIVGSNATYTSGTVTFSGVGGGVTVGSNTGQRIDISVAAPIAQSVQTLGIYGSNNTVGASSSNTYDARSLSIFAGGIISVGWSNGSLELSATVAAQSNQSAIRGFGVSNTGNTAGNTGISTGIDWVLAGSNGITLSQSTAGGGPNTVWMQIPAYLTTADLSQNSSKYIQNWKLTGNTSGTTSSAQGTDLWLGGGNGVTISGSSNSISFSVATNYQSQGAYLTTADLSQNSSKYAQAWELDGNNTAGTTSSLQGTKWFLSGGNNITLSGNSNTIVFSVPSQSNQSAIEGLGASNTGNTAGNTGLSTGIDWVMAGSGAITVSESTTAGGPNTLWFNAPSAAAGNVTFSAGANSAGLASVVFSNSNGVSFGLNGSTITASVAGGGGLASIGISTQGNTAGTTGFASASYQLAGSGAITLSQSTSNNGAYTLTLSVPQTTVLTGVSPVSVSSAGSTISVLLNQASQYDPFAEPALMVTNSSLGQSSLFFYPFDVPYPVSASRVNFFVSIGTTSSNVASSGNGSFGLGYALYSLGTAQDRITQLTSYSAVVITYTSSSGSRFAATHYIGLSNATSHSTSQVALSNVNASTYPANSLGGFRVIALPLNSSLTPGRYWMGVSVQTTNNASASFKVDVSVLQQTFSNLLPFRPFGTSSAASNASVFLPMPGMGTYSAQSAGWPVSIGLSVSDIRAAVSITAPYFNFSGISTGTNFL